jgi:hypothetical protein
VVDAQELLSGPDSKLTTLSALGYSYAVRAEQAEKKDVASRCGSSCCCGAPACAVQVPGYTGPEPLCLASGPRCLASGPSVRGRPTSAPFAAVGPLRRPHTRLWPSLLSGGQQWLATRHHSHLPNLKLRPLLPPLPSGTLRDAITVPVTLPNAQVGVMW